MFCKEQNPGKKRLTFENIRFAERYIEGDTYFFIRFMLPGKFGDFVSRFQCRTETEAQFMLARTLSERSTPSIRSRSCSENETVLVNSVKLMETPEKVIMSAVWTDCVDKIFGLLGKSFCFSARFGFVDFLSLTDRKINRWLSDSHTSRNLARQMIQGSSEIVGNIAQYQPDTRRNFGDIFQRELSGIRFGVVLGNTKITVIPDESNSLNLQVVDVIFGSFDLQEWVV